MSNRKDWEEIEDSEKKRRSNIVGEFGFNIEEYSKSIFSKDSILKRKKRKRIIKTIIFIIFCIVIFSQFYSTHSKLKENLTNKTLNFMEDSYGEKIEIVKKKIYWGGNGFYTWYTKSN